MRLKIDPPISPENITTIVVQIESNVFFDNFSAVFRIIIYSFENYLKENSFLCTHISYNMKKYILIIIVQVLAITATSAQEQTTVATNDTTPALTKKELRKQRVAHRNLHYNILGGPSYTPDFGAVLGGSALLTFRMDPSDSTQLRSVVPMAIAFMFKGGINLFSKPQLFFRGDRFRIFGKFSYKNTEENFYGLGYKTNKDYICLLYTSRAPWFAIDS